MDVGLRIPVFLDKRIGEIMPGDKPAYSSTPVETYADISHPTGMVWKIQMGNIHSTVNVKNIKPVHVEMHYECKSSFKWKSKDCE